MTWCVYMLTCADETLYIGSTNDIERRVRQHNEAKTGAKYTKARRPVVLAYMEPAASMSEARKREAELKRLTRPQKLALLNTVQ